MTNRMPEGNTPHPEPEPNKKSTGQPIVYQSETHEDCSTGWVVMQGEQVIVRLQYNWRTQQWDEIEV